MGEISDSQYAGDHVFYPTMEALNKAKVKPQTIAWQTASGFWVRKEDHI